MEDVPVFRAAKRRKHARLPSESAPEPASQEPGSPSKDETSGTAGGMGDVDPTEADITSLVRARRQFRRTGAGVQFSTTKSRFGEGDETNLTLAKRAKDEPADGPIDITQRFVGSSGQIVDVDQHMIAFIDSEMAKRHNSQHPSTRDMETGTLANASNGTAKVISQPPGSSKPGLSTTTNPASSQQLSEVDLGTSAHELNFARTQAALERARLGHAPFPEEESRPQKPRKPRLGRDGKPMKPRPRRRRNSADLARDALVEQVLNENRLELYDTAPVDGNKGTDHLSTGDTQADERLAEQFRQDFLDAVAERQQRSKAASQPKVPGAASESKGPKLGGSRSARAKMAQLQQQQQGQGQGQGKK